MARKESRPLSAQTDPWLALYPNKADDLIMSEEDHLALTENFYPSDMLSSARHILSRATQEITIPKLEKIYVDYVPNIVDDGFNIRDIPILAASTTQHLSLLDIARKFFLKMDMIAMAWPLSHAVQQVKDVAKDFVLLLMAVRDFGEEKIAQAKAQGQTGAAAKLEKAYKDLCIIDFSGDLDADAKQLFLCKKITGDAFRVTLRTVFKLDSDATDEINGVGNATPTPQTKQRKRIPHIPYKQALGILEGLDCPKDRKTLQRWLRGKNTPDDFTPECMKTLQAFSEWAKIYANREKSKINTNNALRIDNPKSRIMGRFR